MMVVTVMMSVMAVAAVIVTDVIVVMKQTQGRLLTERLYAAPLGLPVG